MPNTGSPARSSRPATDERVPAPTRSLGPARSCSTWVPRVVWFVVLGALGLRQILDNPAVLEAVSPSCGVQLFLDSPLRALLALGSILLVVTRRGRRPTDPASEAPMVDVGGEAIAPGVHRSPGFAVHLFKEPGMAPPALLDNLRHDHSLHEHTLPVSIDTSDAPHVAQRHKAHYTRVVEGVWQVRLLFVLLDRGAANAARFFHLPPDRVVEVGIQVEI